MKLSKVNFLKFNKWFYYFRPTRKLRRKRRKVIKYYIKQYEPKVIGHLICENKYELTTDECFLITIALRYLATKYMAKFEWKKDIIGYNCTKGFRVWILK